MPLKAHKQFHSGFTLLEILLVIGIIAILAGIVIVAINPGRQLAQVRDTERVSDIKQISNALTQYYIDHKGYPTSTPTTLTDICDTGTDSYPSDIDCGEATDLSILVPTYLVAIPKDPQATATSTGYQIVKSDSNKIALAAALTEIGTKVTIGTIPPTTVTYNGNGQTSGSVPVDSDTYKEGESVTVLGNTGSLTKTNYTFSGWNTAANGSGTSRQAGSTFAMGTANVTLYAQWNAWYDPAWSYRQAITIDHTKVGNGTESQTNFPVLISLSGLSHINANGTDIRFTLSDHSTPLAREIESYSSGTLYAWVKIPTLSHTADTVIYMYYGNASATEPAANSTYGSQAVWDSNYAGVWHMNINDSNRLPDSTSRGNIGTNYNASNDEGKLGTAVSFDGNTSWVYVANNSSLEPVSSVSVSTWVNSKTTYRWGYVFNKSRYSNYGLFTSDYAWVNTTGGFLGLPTGPYDGLETWTHISFTYNTVDGGKSYTNGVLSSTAAPTGNISYGGYYSTNKDFTFGSYEWDTPSFHGLIDETRVSNIARSAGWIATEYNNQNSPNTFYDAGSEETP